MKIEVENAQQNEQVDWTKNPQLVCCDEIIVLTNIDQSYSVAKNEFSGFRVDKLNKVEYAIDWDKDQFKPFHGKITLSND